MQLPAHAETSQVRRPTVIGPFGLIADALTQVQNLISRQLADLRPPISSLLKHANIAGGKMIRPGLLLLSYHAVQECKSLQQRTRADGEAISVAAIMEMLHDATLLHDDVIDAGTKRRGLPTINHLWGNDSAVLLGDFLLSRVLKMSADLEPQIQKLIAAAAARTCEGELRQVAQRKNWRLTEDEYIDIIADKTAALFGCCCRLGALLACPLGTGAENSRLEALSSFGHNLGIAFQIIDDLLDIVGNETASGKTLGRDVAGNNVTLLLIHLLNIVAPAEKNSLISKLCTEAHRSQQPVVSSVELLAKLLNRYGSTDYVRNRAKQFVVRAVASLDCLEDGPAKKALIDTGSYIAGRTD
jgi:octaprenyl-diphosphate synthase